MARVPIARLRTIGGVGLLGASSLAYNLGQWSVLVILARLGGDESTAEFALGMAIAAPIAIFFSMGLRVGFITNEADSYGFRSYLNLRLAGAVVTIGATLIWGALVSVDIRVLFAVAICKGLDMVADILAGPSQRAGSLARFSISQIVNGVVSPLALLAGLAVGLEAESAVLLTALGSVGGVWAVVHSDRHLRDALNKLNRRPEILPGGSEFLGYLSAIALPLAVASSATSLGSNLPRYFLDWKGDRLDVGRFAAVGYITVAGTAVVAACAQYLLPRLVALVRERQIRQIRAYWIVWSIGWTLVGLVGVVVSLAFGDEVLGLLYGPGYELDMILAISFVTWTGFAVGWFSELIINSNRKYWHTALINCGAFVPCALIAVSVDGGTIFQAAVLGLVLALLSLAFRTAVAARVLVRLKVAGD